MKGECDGAELAPGPPVREIGEGSNTGHVRDGGAVKVGVVVMGEGQDSGMKSLQVVDGKEEGQSIGKLQIPALKRGSQDTAARSHIMPSAERNHIDVTGNLNIKGVNQESASGSFTMLSFKGRSCDSGRGSFIVPTNIKEGSHDSATGSFSLPFIKGGSRDIVTGGFNLPFVKEGSYYNTTGTLITQSYKESSQESPEITGTEKVNQEMVMGSLQMPFVKEEYQGSASGKLSVSCNKGVSQDNATGNINMKTDIKRVSEDNASGTVNMAPSKREGQYSAIESIQQATITAVKRKNQNNVSKSQMVPVVKDENQESAIVKSAATILTGEDENRVSENSKLPVAREEIHCSPTGIVAVPEVKRDTQDGGTGNSDVSVVNRQRISDISVIDMRQDSAVESMIEGGTQTSTLEPLLPQTKPDLQQNYEKKTENTMTDDQKTSERGYKKENLSEDAVQVCSSIPGKCHFFSSGGRCRSSISGSPKAKSAEEGNLDKYNFVIEDGEDGEECGGCDSGKKPHKCCQCDTSFRTPYELSRHGRVHSGERPYQCHLCHRCFKRKDHVEVHTRRHVEDRRHMCGLCDSWFMTSSCLLRHQRRTHQTCEDSSGTKHKANEGEDGEVEGTEGSEGGDPKGDPKDQPASKDSQKNGRRNKKNKPDTTYRPGGKTVCIIKKRNLRQRSYSFVELEDDVECFESDEEDKIPFLKIQEERAASQRAEEEREEAASHVSHLEHSLFPPSFFSQEASLEQLILLGEVGHLLSHSLAPGPSSEGAGCQTSVSTQLGKVGEPEEDFRGESDDSDCDPPLVACDVTFLEAEGEVTSLTLPEDNLTEDASAKVSQVTSHNKEVQASGTDAPLITHTTGKKVTYAHTEESTSVTPHTAGRRMSPQSNVVLLPPINSKVSPQGAGTIAMPRTARVITTNSTRSGKNTCDACRKRNEANRLAQAEKEKQMREASDLAIKKEMEIEKVKSVSQSHDKKQPEYVQGKLEETKSPITQTDGGGVAAVPVSSYPPLCPQKPKAGSKRGRKPHQGSGTKKRKTSKGGEADKGMATLQRPHKCPLCPFSFRSTTELSRHSSTHSGERPFLCELCGAGFVRKCHLQLHVRRHSGERRHACQDCRMRFFTPSDLARHQVVHEFVDEPLECHLCHLTFRRAFHLEQHIQRHLEAAPYACSLCGALFSSAAALRGHDKHHRIPGPHACSDCTAAFTTATALSRHRRVHTARHHRLLRTMEHRITPTKSSYECVSSEGSPLSLVIRKVASTTGLPEDGNHEGARVEAGNDQDGTRPEAIKMGLVDGGKAVESKEEAGDSITSAHSTTIKGEEVKKEITDNVLSHNSTCKGEEVKELSNVAVDLSSAVKNNNMVDQENITISYKETRMKNNNENNTSSLIAASKDKLIKEEAKHNRTSDILGGTVSNKESVIKEEISCWKTSNSFDTNKETEHKEQDNTNDRSSASSEVRGTCNDKSNNKSNLSLLVTAEGKKEIENENVSVVAKDKGVKTVREEIDCRTTSNLHAAGTGEFQCSASMYPEGEKDSNKSGTKESEQRDSVKKGEAIIS